MSHFSRLARGGNGSEFCHGVNSSLTSPSPYRFFAFRDLGVVLSTKYRNCEAYEQSLCNQLLALAGGQQIPRHEKPRLWMTRLGVAGMRVFFVK